MDDLIERAENTDAAPPADVENVEETSTETEAPELAEQEADAPQAENGDAVVEDKREKMIPRERYDQKDAEYKTVKQQLAERETAFASERQQITQAANAGYRSVEAYQQATANAKAQGYDSAETLDELIEYNQSLEAKKAEGFLTDEAQYELLQSRRERIETQNLLKQTQQQVAQINNQSLKTLIADEMAKLGELDPEMKASLEAQLTKFAHPQAIKDTVATYKLLVEGVQKKAVSKYAAEKAADRKGGAPEGRGGTPPPVAPSNDKSWMGSSWGKLMDNMGKTA
jgi:hypothetical protein